MSDITDSIQYYVDLLIMQYNDKPKALAHIEALIEPVVAELLPIDMMNAFDLETAVGDQLDMIGKIIGVSRSGKTITRAVTLDDDDYRQLIKIGIVKNNSKSSLYDIQVLLNTFFPDTILVFDYQNMSMSYLFDSTIGSEQLAEMFIVNDLLPKPMGVQLGALIYGPSILTFFNFRTYSLESYNGSPMNTYSSYDMDSKWLSYADAIIV